VQERQQPQFFRPDSLEKEPGQDFTPSACNSNERERLRYLPLGFSVYSGPANNYTSVKTLLPSPQTRGTPGEPFRSSTSLNAGRWKRREERVTPGVPQRPGGF